MPVGIPVTGDAADRLRRQWSRALTDRAAATVVDLDHLERRATRSRHDYAITTRVTLAALDATAGQRINLHAGAVADDEGRALAVIGAVGLGQDDRRSRLLAHRLGYLSDETVSLDERARRAPPPQAAVGDHRPRTPRSVEAVRLPRRPRPAATPRRRRTCTGIVLLHRGDDDSGLVPLAPAHAIAEIVEQTSSLVQLEHPILPPGRRHRRVRRGVGPALPRVRATGSTSSSACSTASRSRRPAPAPPPASGRGRGRGGAGQRGAARRGSTRWSTTTSWC